MTRRIRQFALVLTVFAVLILIGWWSIGPTWRLFLSNPPTKTDVLFWEQSQRDSGFALGDQIPFVKTVPIEQGDAPRALEIGDPLVTDYDIPAFMERQNSASIVILHKGLVRYEAYGLNQTADKRWTSFSVAKAMTSTLLGIALAEGHIESLDDPVSQYIEELQGSAYDDVTIHQLLTMTSGVAWTEDYDDPTSDVALFNEAEGEGDTPAIVAYLKDLPRAHEPGTVFNYSTGETNLVGILIEAAVGQTLNIYLSEKIWVPYGMAGYASWVTSDSGEPISGCCIQATGRDFARFGQFILEGGQVDGASVLPDGWLSEATRTQIRTDRNQTFDYGYQWWTRDDGSFAALGAFGQSIFIDPNRDLVIAANASWRDARGNISDQRADRDLFFEAIQASIDAEGG
ncbi:MAG: serine hydrolase [Pseudomonadota bacterium]